MSSEAMLRIIILIIGLFVIAGILLHYHLTRRRVRPPAARSNRREPQLNELDLPLAEDVTEPDEAQPSADWGRFEELDDPPLLNDPPPSSPPAARPPSATAAHQPVPQAKSEPPPRPLHMSAAKSPPSAAGVNVVPRQTPEKIITLYIRGRGRSQISGVELLDAAIKTGLQFGTGKIFHRIDEGIRMPIFSMANLVKPGYFEPGSWNTFETPGVSLFMTLPGPLGALDTWDAMHAAGQRLADLLHADLLDDSRCLMTRQRIGQMREDMREYDRRSEIQRDLDQ